MRRRSRHSNSGWSRDSCTRCRSASRRPPRGRRSARPARRRYDRLLVVGRAVETVRSTTTEALDRPVDALTVDRGAFLVELLRQRGRGRTQHPLHVALGDRFEDVVEPLEREATALGFECASGELTYPVVFDAGFGHPLDSGVVCRFVPVLWEVADANVHT